FRRQRESGPVLCHPAGHLRRRTPGANPMSKLERRLGELGLSLPPALTAVANYRPVKRSDPYLFISGHGPFGAHGPQYTGVVGAGLSVDDGRAAAELTMLSIFATLKAELGDLD